MDKSNSKDVLWNAFSSTGKLGVYLLYKAIDGAMDSPKGHDDK